MIRQTTVIAILLAALTAGGLAVSAYSADNEVSNGAKEQAAIAAAKISLQQAISAAQQKTGGIAVHAGIENQDGTVVFYDVTIDKGGARQKVLVDMQTGNVVKVVPENEDNDGETNDSGSESEN